MALSFFSGSFTSRTTVGTDVITGVGFQPKVIIFFASSANTADETYAADFRFRMGFAVDTTAANQRSTDQWSRDGTGNSFTERAFAASAAFCVESGGTGFSAKGVISAIGADGFTVNWTSTDAVAKVINYICLGGTDITNAKVGAITSPTSGTTGNQATTGIGFQSDLVILFSGGLAADAAAFNVQWGLGFMTTSTDQACLCGVSKEAVATRSNKRYQRASNTNCFALLDVATTTTKALEGNLVSMDSDGFTINWTTVGTNGASKSIAYLAIKGGNYETLTITSPTSGTAPVSQSTTGAGFQPVGLIAASVGNTSTTSVSANNRVSFGGGSSSSLARNMWAGDSDATATSVTAKIHRDAKLISVITENATHTSSTINASAGITSLDADGFTLSWDTRDTNAYEVICLACGSAASGKNLYVSKAFFRADG